MRISFEPSTITEEDALEIVTLLGRRFNLLGTTSSEAISVATTSAGAPSDAAEKLMHAVAANKVANDAASGPKDPIDWSLLDGAGMPWDERIHASTKTKLKDDTWKLLRGVEQTLVDACRLEVLDARSEASGEETPSVPAAPTAPEPEVELGPLEPTEKAGETPLDAFLSQGWTEETLIEHGYFERKPIIKAPPAAPAAPSAPAAPAAPAAPSAPAAPTGAEDPSAKFTRVMAEVQALQKSGKVTGPQLTEIYKAHGLQSIAQALTNPDALAKIEADIKKLVGA